jgi:hypothetical protein
LDLYRSCVQTHPYTTLVRTNNTHQEWSIRASLCEGHACSTYIKLGNRNLCGTEKNRYSKNRPNLMLDTHSSTDLILYFNLENLKKLYSQSILLHISVADPGCLSRIRIFPSRIQGQKDPGSASASNYLNIFNPKIVSKLSEI